VSDEANAGSAATDVSLREYAAGLSAGEMNWFLKWLEERDRRYAEVNVEKEKALKIKEEADKAALALAREIQTYKDEKANELREQINSERGLYLTRDEYQTAHVALIEKVEAGLKPLNEFVTAQQGKFESRTEGHARIGTGTAMVGSALGILFLLFTYLNYQANSKPAVTPPTVTVTTPAVKP
jgi:hypothetical protein